MNTHCSTALLESALAGNLPAEDETSLNRHLESCEACSAALEQMAGGHAWCREAASLLATDELDAAVPAHDEWSDIDFTVEHLEPSDEPNVLGRLGGYDVHQIIGRGGMGIVLKGFDRELKRPVAIKVLSPHLAQSSLAKKRFAREAQAAAAVVHPHVMPIHQVHAGGRLPFLVMPLLSGESLAERLASQGSLELKETLRIGMQAAAGLAAAHEQGLVHRDVKPANILLEKGVERAVLTDFGLARAADDVTLTRWGIVAGTPQYMSPEQARGEPLDSRSDLFSLGCVLYEMATGVSPFRTESVMATMRRLVDDAPKALASLNPELPPWFIAIVNRLLEKDPSRRFNSAAEVSQLLENCLAHLQQPAVVPLPASLAPFAARPSRMFNFTRKEVLVMLSAIVAALLGIMLWQSSNPPNIAGNWTGPEWNEVVLKQTEPGEYEGTYTDTYKGTPGTIQLKWSRTERRFKGTWEEGKLRYGKISLRLVGDEIRGAWTTDEKSTINPGTPELADLTWVRPAQAATKLEGDWRLDFVTGGGVKGWEQNLKVRVRSNKWTTIRPSGETPNRLVLGGDDNDQAIDLIQDQGSKPPVINRGLYHLHGDTLTIAWGSPASKRPTGFEGIEAGVHTWKRIKADEIATKTKTPPLPDHPPGISANGDPNQDPGKPMAPIVADPSPGNGERPPDTAGFTETKEFVLSMGSSKFMLDLDTGQTMDPPATAGRPEQELMDVHPNQVQPYHYPTGLSGLSLVAREMKSSDWNASAADVHRALTGNIQRLPHMDIGPSSPTTYFFKTRAGTEGILQLLSLVEDPKGIRVRYKTLITDPPSAAGQRASLPEKTSAMPKLVHTFQTSDNVATIAISADGSRIAVANGNPTFILQTSGTSRLKDDWKPSAEILEAKTGKPVVTLKLSTAEEDAVLAATERVYHFEVTTLAFSPDASLLAVGTSIGQVKLYNAQTGELVRSLDDEKPKLADKETPENWKSLSRAMGSVKSLAFSPDGSLLAVCGSSFEDFSDVFDGIRSLGLSATGPGRLKLWEAKTGTLKHDLPGHSQAFAVAFSSDGSILASSGRWSGPDHGNGVLIWNPQTGEKTRTILVEANGGTHSVAFAPHKKLMAFGSVKFDKENDTSSTSIGVAYPLSGITEWQQTIPGWATPAFSPDGNTIVVLARGQSLRFVDAETGTVKHELNATDSPSVEKWNAFAIAPKANLLAIGGTIAEKRGSVTIWDLNELTQHK